MNKIYHYYVEGECEEKLINTLKDGANGLIIPGKVDVFNVQTHLFTQLQLRPIGIDTTIILIFDTDVSNISKLDKNIELLKTFGFTKIWTIMQNKNLEEELINSTDIEDIKQLLPTKTKKEFKSAFIKEKNLMLKLKQHNFDINKLWANKAKEDYSKYSNDGNKIKLIK